jgi:RNA polymerase sigma factor (sigma-70 family)
MCAPEVTLERLYQAHAGELHGFARRKVGRQDAEDVVQEAYLHLLQTGASARLEQPRAYLFRIAANIAVDAARKVKTRSRYADDEALFLGFVEAPVCPESEAVRTLEMRRFHASLAELPARCREAFVLNQIEGRTRAEIATKLGLSVRTVDRHIFKAFAHVRRRLQAPEHPPASIAKAKVVKMREAKSEPLADTTTTGRERTARSPHKKAA